MNKFFKRLALLLAVLMIVSMMPVQLFADNGVTGEEQSNGTGESKSAIVVRYFMGESSVDREYDASVIASAVSEIADNIDEGVTAITVTLNEDVTATSTLTFANDVTFDLNGHTLTVATDGDGIVVNNAALTLTNSGTTGKYVFDCSAGRSDGIFVNNTEDGKTSTLNINSDVEIHANPSVNSAIHAYASTGTVVVNMNAGKIAVTGENGEFPAIIADQNSTINVDGGEFDLNVDFDSYGNDNDVVGVLVWGQNGVQKNIAVNIKTGAFKVGGKNAFAQAVQVGMKNDKSENCTVNISGGEVILNPTENGTGYVYATYKTSYATAEISGGKVSGNVTALVNPYMTVDEIENDGLTISGGTFTTTSGTTLNVEKHLAEGFTITESTDAEGNKTYGVEKKVTEVKPFEVWTGFSGTKVAAYKTLAEAVANLGENKWIVVGGDYTLTEDFTIPEGIFLDVAAGVTLTIADGVTLTVAANCKRLGVRSGATVVNNGTILVCGTSYSAGYVMLPGTLKGKALNIPDGCFLDNNNNNYFATANENAVYEIAFSDGSVKLTADSTNIKGGNITQIKLLKDVTKGGWSLGNDIGPEVVLDLNGHTLSYNGTNRNYATLNISTKVTIKNGTVKYTGTSRGAIDLTSSGELIIASDAVIDGGASYGIFTSGFSKLTVYGNVSANGNYAIAGNGSESAGSIDNCNIIIENGAVISAPNGIAIYHPELGTVTVNGGKISGETGIQICAGKLVVNGGEITSTGANVDHTGSQNAMPDGAAISIINRNYPGGIPTLEIAGGTIKATGKDALAVKAYDYTNNTVATWTDAGNYINISGGNFSHEIPKDYCAAGFMPTKNADGTYSVKEGKYVAQIDNVKYETLAEAIAAAKDGDTIKLLADVEQNSALTVDKSITLDLSGKKIYNTVDIWDANATPVVVSLLSIEKGAAVIITGNGTIVAKDNDCYTFNVVDGNLTIENGNYIGNISVVQVEKGTLTVNGGSFSLIQKMTDGKGADRYLFNCIDAAFAAGDAKVAVSGGTFAGFDPNVAPEAKVDGKAPSFAADGVGVTKNADGTFTAETGMVAQVLDADGNSVKAYATLAEAIAAAKDGETVKLLTDVTVDAQITVNAAITLDLGGKTVTSTWAMAANAVGEASYALLLKADVTVKNGTFAAGKARAIGAYGALTLDQVNVSTQLTDGNACVALCANGKTYTVKNAHIDGAYALAIFANNATVNVSDSTLTGNGNVLYHNGSNYGLKLTVSNTTIKSTGSCGVYISGSTDAQANSANQNGAGGYQQATFTNCTIEGFTAIEVKYTDLTLDDCTVTATDKDVKYVQDNNGPATRGFAVVSTDNAKQATPKPLGSITIKGNGKFTGPVGLGSLASVKETYKDFEDKTIAISGGTFSHEIPKDYCAAGFMPTKNADGTYGVVESVKGTKDNPYTLEEFGKMTRAEYIAAQEKLGGTMYVDVGAYSYDQYGTLGNGERNDIVGQIPDHSKLNAYGENGYLGDKNDGANGKNVVFVGSSITSGTTGYKNIDNIGTYLLLAVPAYTNVTFEGITFNNVMNFNYQLYTSPWSQLGSIEFKNCTFNGIIVGAIAAQTLAFRGCEFKSYTNTVSANNSNPTWIRPAYGNWTKGDNEGQGSDFRSLTTIIFENNKVTSTRPVKFEYISQWDITSTVTVTGNYFDITAQSNDTEIKNVGLYLGAHTDANEFHLVAADNTKSENTAALYTIPSGKTSLPVGSTVKNPAGESIELTDALKWKATDSEKDKIVLKTVIAVASIGENRFATLEEAFAAAKNGDTITLLEDCKSDRINLEDKSITVVLNGKTLTSTAAYGVMFCAKNGNKITIDGTVEGSKLVGTLMITEGTDGHIEVNGGTYESSQYCPIYVNGAVNSENSTVTVKNAIIKATNSNSKQDMGCGVYLAGYSTSVFVNCTITAPATGIEIRAGKLTLNNCDVTGGNGEVTADANDNGTTVTNAALAISQHNTKKPIEVIINGGTFTGTAAVYQTDVQGTGSADVKIAVKSGTFNGTISGETDGTIVISDGKFKVKVDDKYFEDGHVCSGNPGADGYYTVAGHPIISKGLTIGESLTLRITVDKIYKNGKLKYTYIGAKDGKVHSGIVYRAEKDKEGNWVFRISDINAQRADVIYTVQYVDESEKEVGSAKEVSILKYCESLVEKYKNADEVAKNRVNTLVCKLLNYSAAAMDYRQETDKDDKYNNMTWGERATALRKRTVELCGTVTDYAFEVSHEIRDYGTDKNAVGVNGEKKVGIEFSDKIRLFFNINYNENYTYTYNGLKCIPEEVSGASTTHRIYVTVAPFAYDSEHCIVISDADGFVYEIAYSLDNALQSFAGKYSGTATGNLAKATYEYCRALTDYAKYFK